MDDFWPRAIEHTDGSVTIRPLRMDDAPGFLDAYRLDLETFRHFSAYPEPSLDSVEEFILDRSAPGSFGQAILVDGEFVGSSAYFDIRSADRALEIGYTWYAPRFRGTKLNPIVKRAMIGAAIEEFGAMRVQLKTGSKNLQSQQAMENIGLVKEGTLRNHVRMPNGEWRDTVFFSLIPEEWPEVHRRLDELIGARPSW